jgi:AraC-like DNA-binding protein
MNVYLDPLNIFRFICVTQGFSIGLFLIVADWRNKTKFWLGILLSILSCSILDHFLSASGIYFRHNRIYFMPLFFTWGFGPVLYFYVVNFLQVKAKLKTGHFIPVIIQFLFYAILVLQPLAYKTWFWQHVHKPYTRFAEYYGMCFSVLIYIALIFKYYQDELRAAQWLKWLVGSLALFFTIALADPLINVWYQPVSMPKFYVITFLLPISICWLVLISLLYERLSARRQQKPDRTYDAKILEKIRNQVEKEFAYRDAELTLQSLSVSLGVTANTISKTVNRATGQTFSDYLNGLRIAEVKHRLLYDEAKKFTILSIAYDAGFNSKTTFNRVFKQSTGLSPKDYLYNLDKAAS